MGHNVTRRGFIGAAATGAALICLGGAGVAGKRDAVHLRPPGFADESDLLARCNRCGKCVEACPYAIVQPLPLSLNLASVATPALTFKHGFCDFCGKCWQACPTGALSANAPSAANIGVAKVISDACVAWGWSGCTVCVDACPVEGAISLDEHGRPSVNEQACNGCGACEQKCPSSSLRSYDANVAERAIYVVPRESQAALLPGAITSAELEAGRSVRTGVGAGAHVSAGAGANAGAHVSAGAKANAGADAHAGAGANAGAGTHAGAGTGAQASASANASAFAGAGASTSA